MGRIFPCVQLELTALTKEVIKNQLCNFTFAYFPMIDPEDFVEGERFCIIFTNLFSNSSLKNAGKKAIFHHKAKQTNKSRVKINFRPASGLHK